MKKMTGKSFALSALVAASFMAAGAMASDKTEPRNEVYKDKFKNQYNSWHDTAKSEELVDAIGQDQRNPVARIQTLRAQVRGKVLHLCPELRIVDLVLAVNHRRAPRIFSGNFDDAGNTGRGVAHRHRVSAGELTADERVNGLYGIEIRGDHFVGHDR